MASWNRTTGEGQHFETLSEVLASMNIHPGTITVIGDRTYETDSSSLDLNHWSGIETKDFGSRDLCNLCRGACFK